MDKVIDPIAHELLRDIRELTSRQFTYDARLHVYVPMDGAPTDCPIGPSLSFADLARRDKADVLIFVMWEHYGENGLDGRDLYAIWNNVTEGLPPHRWLEGTSFVEPSIRAEIREELIKETFELSREIGYAHFLAEDFGRPDPTLVRLGREEREAFLRQWWDGARERVYESYLGQVAGMSNEELARSREAYNEAMVGVRGALRDQLFAPTQPEPQPSPEHSNERPHRR